MISHDHKEKNMRSDTVKIPNKGHTRIIAHRGVSGLECENSAAAFIAAGNRTHFGVETDFWRTNDGKYICNHDGHTGRICEHDLVIEESSFDDLRALILKDTDGSSDRTEIRLATPYEYKKICQKYAKHCVPELKSRFRIEEIRELMDTFGDYLDSTTFISFSMDNLDLVKEVKKDQKCQFLTSSWDDSLPEMLASRQMGLDIYYPSLSEERIAACHAAGIEVNCWTVDDPDAAAQLITWGVDYITSNILE